ncbi:MAG: hypothetical protein NVS4B7_03740 [Ktedonobacteraceae bacterium]
MAWSADGQALQLDKKTRKPGLRGKRYALLSFMISAQAGTVDYTSCRSCYTKRLANNDEYEDIAYHS